jgi:hypothetical protein
MLASKHRDLATHLWSNHSFQKQVLIYLFFPQNMKTWRNHKIPPDKLINEDQLGAGPP